MKTIVAILFFFSTTSNITIAQTFIDKAKIEFEVKTNIKKTIGTGMWADMLNENLPQFKTGYYDFVFSGNKSIYKFNRWSDGPKVPQFLLNDSEGEIYYMDHDKDKIFQQKIVAGSPFFVEDSIPAISWKFTNENRMIAGFNCRKAVGIVMDSVYVFAFYTDEILIPGGPCSISGLPGMVLGLTIPRLYVSYIATKVIVNGVKDEDVKPITAKKFNSRSQLRALLLDRFKENGNNDDIESRDWLNQFLWSALL